MTCSRLFFSGSTPPHCPCPPCPATLHLFKVYCEICQAGPGVAKLIESAKHLGIQTDGLRDRLDDLHDTQELLRRADARIISATFDNPLPAITSATPFPKPRRKA